MRTPQQFDYNQPCHDTLAGIYVEASDIATTTPVADLPGGHEGHVLGSQMERLFGITLSVDEQPSQKLGRT